MVQFIFEGSRTNFIFWSKFAYVLVRTGVDYDRRHIWKPRKFNESRIMIGNPSGNGEKITRESLTHISALNNKYKTRGMSSVQNFKLR